jgi:hypothetical protein
MKTDRLLGKNGPSPNLRPSLQHGIDPLAPRVIVGFMMPMLRYVSGPILVCRNGA